ncbi:MAG: hypothetical protein O3C63_06970 [Cyanobacteria bacterium]|nr:hypothetical protein [Cyanobacteriota bacterium]
MGDNLDISLSSRVNTEPVAGVTDRADLPAAATSVTRAELNGVSAAPITVDEILELLLVFRQTDNKFKDQIEKYLTMNLEQLRRFAPDLATLMTALELSVAERTVYMKAPGASKTMLDRAVAQRKKQHTPDFQKVVTLVQTLIKLIEKMHVLFPSMSEEDFHNQVFTSPGDGIKDLVEALTEIHPVNISSKKGDKGKKSPKLSRAAQAKARMKPITTNQGSRERLQAFVELLDFHGDKQNSAAAQDFAKRLREQLKLDEV